MDSQLKYFADALRVPEVAQAKPSDASADPGPSRRVLEAQLPLGERLRAVRCCVDPDRRLFWHRPSVALKLPLGHRMPATLPPDVIREIR